MSLISITVPNLISGVSQQADALRFASQAEDSVNAYPSLVEGLIKRPASQHIAKLINNSAGDVSVHTINRDATEQYTAVFTTDAGAPVKVFDMNGVAKTVYLATGAAAYLPASPSTHIKCLTVADYTLVLNKNKTVLLDAAVGPSGYPEALVFIKQGGYQIDYVIEISYGATVNKYVLHSGDGTDTAATRPYTTINGGSKVTYNDATWPKGENASSLSIAKFLTQVIEGHDATVIAEQIGSTIYIKRTSNQAFTINVSDSLSGGGIKLVEDKVQSFVDLPIYAEDGFVTKITGEPESEGDEYWVKFEATNGGKGAGVWTETVGYEDDVNRSGLKYKYTASTLPHALVRLPNGSFLFTPLDGATGTYGGQSYTAPEWGERKAGDDDTNPSASFTSRKLSDMLFYKNRLAFLSDENIIFSEASEFFNFWRTTVTQLLDADPIDVATSSTKVSILFAGVPFFDRLLLFSNQTQFTLQSADNLTAKSVSIQNTTSFECSPLSVPVSVGKNVYFAFTKNNFSGIQEYFISPDTTLLDGTDISASIPSFIAGTVSKLAGSDNEQVLAILSSGLPNGFYLYKYLFNGNEKLQSAWCRMELASNCSIKNIDFINNTLYLTIQRGTEGLFLEKIELQAYKNDANSPYSVLLDRKVSDATAGVSRAFNSGTGKTTITLPYVISSTNAAVVTRAVGNFIGGAIVDVDSVSTNTVVVTGDYTAVPIWVGERYSMTHTMGRVVLRASTQKGGTAVVSSGKLYLKRASLQYNNSRSFTIKVVHENETNPDIYEYVFNSQIVGTPTATIGQNNILDGVFKFPILSKNDRVIIQLTNDTPHPCALLSMDIEAQYVTRSQRLG
jgi:hypothetical protein